MADEQSFFVTTGPGRYRATTHTGGPWDPRLQHGGPPEALLAREILVVAGAPELVLGRVTYELLGPIPVGDVVIATEITRPGKRVQMVEATLEAGGRTAIRARAWQIARGGARAAGETPAPAPLPDEESPLEPPWDRSGYLHAMEWRLTRGGFNVHGPGGVWARPRMPLVDDEPPTPLSRLLLLADSANGISGPLPLASWFFIPPETTIHLLRDPEGDWVHLDATTTVEPNGPGVCHGTLADARGPVGFVSQSLLVAPR